MVECHNKRDKRGTYTHNYTVFFTMHTCKQVRSQPSLMTLARREGSKRAVSITGSGKSLHDPVSMYEDESMASLKEKLSRGEEVTR